MKTISITIDVEPDLQKTQTQKTYKGITQGLKKFEKISNKKNIKATFFITCDCLNKYPEIFKNLKKQGHEIALHGFKHVNFKTLSKKQKQKQIKKSILCFKKHLKQKPRGFRAPQHSIDNETLDILVKNNFKYDSSYSPFNFYHILFPKKINIKFKDNFTPKKIYKIRKNFYEIPISTFILPFSALTFRLLPNFLLRIFLFFISLTKNPVFMMHSWDLIELKKSRLYKKCSLECFIEKLNLMLNYFPKNKFKKIKDLI